MKIMGVLLVLMASCAGTSMHSTTGCEVDNIQHILDDPLYYSGKVFCGHVYTGEDSEVMVFLPAKGANWRAALANPILLAGKPLNGVEQPYPQNQRVLVRGRIIPQFSCFRKDVVGGEECVPFGKPILIEDYIVLKK